MCSEVRLCASSLGRAGGPVLRKRGAADCLLGLAGRDKTGDPRRSRPHQVREKQMSSTGSSGHADKFPAAGRPPCGWRSQAAWRAGHRARTSGADTWKCAFPLPVPLPRVSPPPPPQKAQPGGVPHPAGLLGLKHVLELSETACAIFVRFRIPSARSKLTFLQLPPRFSHPPRCTFGWCPRSRGALLWNYVEV